MLVNKKRGVPDNPWIEPAAVRQVHDAKWLRGLLQRLNWVVEGLSVTEVADLTQFNLETARRHLRFGPPSAEFIRQICVTFAVSADWLLLGRGAGPFRRG